ncbi:MAG: hypothetical protein H0W74_10585 [Sphingosinicella sp.]|nr:hypothetical protein [Sphingosinicella sp.]
MNKMNRMAAAALLALTAASAATAQERSAIKEGFALPANSEKRILVFRPKVSVGAQSTGGLFEPRAEWTDQARVNIQAALVKRQVDLGNVIVSAPEGYGDHARLVEEYTNLFDAVAQAVVTYQFFKGNRLPTKKGNYILELAKWQAYMSRDRPALVITLQNVVPMFRNPFRRRPVSWWTHLSLNFWTSFADQRLNGSLKSRLVP